MRVLAGRGVWFVTWLHSEASHLDQGTGGEAGHPRHPSQALCSFEGAGILRARLSYGRRPDSISSAALLGAAVVDSDGKQPSGKIKVLYDSAVQKLLDEVGLRVSLLDAANKSEWHNITRPEALAAQPEARAASRFPAQVAAKRPSAVTKGAASSTSRAACASVASGAGNMQN